MDEVTDAPSADEQKFFETGGAAAPVEAPAEEKPQGQAPAAAEKPPAAPAQEQPKPQSMVPIGALHEARAELRKLREEVERLKSPPQKAPEVPALEADPVGNLDTRIKTVAQTAEEIAKWRQEQEQRAQHEANERAFIETYAAKAREFSTKQPDFRDAYTYLINARDQQLQTLGFADPQQRGNIITAEERGVVATALHQGANPAERLYSYAKSLGFKAPAQKPQETPAEQVERTQKTQAAAKSLGGASGQGTEKLNIASVAEMSDEDFAKLSSEDWQKLFRAA